MPGKYYFFSKIDFEKCFVVNRTKQSDWDALESMRNVHLHGNVCRVATRSNLSGFFSNCGFTRTLLERNKLAFERMLQEELLVKVVLKSSL